MACSVRASQRWLTGLPQQFNVPLIHVHAEERYAELLAGVTEPEMASLIGTEFWKSFFDGPKLDGVQFLAQGTSALTLWVWCS